MTIFAGIFALNAERDVAEGSVRELTAAMSRRPEDTPSLHRRPGFALAYLDVGSLPGGGEITADNGTRTVLAGDLLLRSRQEVTRTDDLKLLHDAWSRGDESL